MGGGLVLVVLLAWCYLLAGAGMHVPGPAGAGMSMAGEARSGDAARWIVMLLMWWIMMIAMMVPSAAPMILLYAKVYRKGHASGQLAAPYAPTAAFAGGYLLAWLLFSVGAVLLHFSLEALGLVERMTMGSTSQRLSALFLVVAGLYQFSPWKYRCLAQCRSPVSFLSTHWRRSPAGAARAGLEHGFYCVGCCWSLMLLLFVGGVMSLLWIAGLAVLVLGEKLLPRGARVAQGAGAVMIAAGIVWLL
ncbi:MAG TPA: DUF2182 domain-containing protein [Woeseiaceae bacterium]